MEIIETRVSVSTSIDFTVQHESSNFHPVTRSYLRPDAKMYGPHQEEYHREILWAGIFGSVSRNRAHEESDVDILIVLKHGRTGEPVDLRERLAEVCGREISLLCIWQGPKWAWGVVRVEALLSSRTVYGNRGDIEHLRLDGMTILNDGLQRFDLIAEAVEGINNQVSAVQTYENFILPTQQPARQKCIQELRKIVDQLDIPQLHHPIRTMLVLYVFEDADKIRLSLDEAQSDVIVGTAPIWRVIWDNLQPKSRTMWSFQTGCALFGPQLIRHMLASKRLADTFEEGGPITEDMYSEILR